MEESCFELDDDFVSSGTKSCNPLQNLETIENNSNNNKLLKKPKTAIEISKQQKAKSLKKKIKK